MLDSQDPFRVGEVITGLGVSLIRDVDDVVWGCNGVWRVEGCTVLSLPTVELGGALTSGDVGAFPCCRLR